MITTRDFRIELIQLYTVKGWVFKEVLPIGPNGKNIVEDLATRAKEEFDRQVNEATKSFGQLVQVLKYEVREWGGCKDEWDEPVARHYVIEATVMFRRG